MKSPLLAKRLVSVGILLFLIGTIPYAIEARKGGPPYWLQMSQEEVTSYRSMMAVLTPASAVCIVLSIVLFALGILIWRKSRNSH